MKSPLIVRQAYTQEVLTELNYHSSADVENMLKTAQKLHKQGAIPAYKRIDILQRLAIKMQAQHQTLSELIANEGGKPIKDARVEVTRAIDGIRLALAEIQNGKGEEVPMDTSEAGAGRMAFTSLEPIGVVVAVSAFNHPLNLIVHQVVPAIATGCPVIVKPAVTTPLSCLKFAELVYESGLDKGWLQVAITSKELSEQLVRDSRVAFFSFIGSANVGWMLKSKLAPGTRCALEHGGVAPTIVNQYEDMTGLYQALSHSAFYHAGQVCVSTQRVFVPAKQAQEVVQQFAPYAAQKVIGDAINEETDVGPLILPHEVDRVEKWVNEAIDEGATLISGGQRVNEVCYQPTILLNPKPTSKVSTLEIFAPVVCIYGYEKLTDAIAQSNSLNVAFQASVFSDNIHTAMNTAKALDASAVMINDHSAFRVDWMPFAGRRHSGYGIGGIAHTMHDMLQHKMFVIKTH